ncbi:hypothetical protein K388_02683 [Streptomyces sp. KhCrAH-43]|nr:MULTISPECIES: hypothetical protein [unclassified Streptomyces]RAJ61997.1 hypothetical protein K388_02683 [Streptomyces sp. KhCrAH-43]
MTVPTGPARCAHAACGKPVKKDSKTGRPKLYCDTQCRRRAQWARDRARRSVTGTPPPADEFSPAIATDIAAVAQQLQKAAQRQAPLEVRFGLAQLLQREVTCYVGVAVQDERAVGEAWSTIGMATGTSEASARACWSETKVAAQLAARPRNAAARRARQLDVERPVDWVFTRPAGRTQRAAARVLRRYLTALRDAAALSVEDVAREARMPNDAITLGVEGELIASWPVTYMVVTILGGDPGELRMAWEAASGEADYGSAAEAERSLGGVLRPLYLAAGAPPAPDLAARARLDPEDVEHALAGGLLDWRSTESLTAALDAEPSIVAPFWSICAQAKDGGA